MKHEWERLNALVPHRRCLNCGAEQKYLVHEYDRIHGSRYAWYPRVGRCKPTAPHRTEAI